MDRRITRSMAVLGLGCLAAATGCQSFLHRATVPPAPRSPREGGQVGFSSAPKPAQSAMNGLGQPNGPIAYSLMKRQDGSNSGLIACSATMISATAIVPAAATRAAMAAG